MPRRNEEDLLNPERTYYRLLRDYVDGHLTQHSLRLYRAVVLDVATTVGQFEQIPPCPINSVRARVYSAGLDNNIPTSALTIFHPLMPGHLSPPVSPGEHVYVIFEDHNFSNGFWISTIPHHTDINDGNPDIRERESSPDASRAFEGSNASPAASSGSVSHAYQYGGATVRTTGEPRLVENVERGTRSENPFEGKRVIHIGDSMVGGARTEPGSERSRQWRGPVPFYLSRTLPREYRAQYYKAHGRIGWGVADWNTGRFSGAKRGLAIPQPSVTDLIRSERADIVLCTLGGNDASNGWWERDDYEDQIRRLWNEMQQVSGFAIWCGSPSVVPRSSEDPERGAARIREFNRKRNIVNQKIRSVVGNNYLDCTQLTNTSEGRQPDGVHFRIRASIGETWGQLFIDKARSL